ncbi:MAG: LLM class flavin-dependent oxidoreductase [Acidimicrobiaceae bacterium]|nr:LLM class flavin-dependent oxidoreductase [Acidimicrobiaceae bacterium]
MAAITLAYDMRAPEWGSSAERLYRAALDQCAWADQAGFDSVVVMEHHASDDGYLPSPIVLGAAIAGVTRRMPLRLSLILLPLYHPLRAAEDLAVLDLVSGGRLEVTVGLGYREEEYAQFGVNMRRRPSLMEEAVEALKQAWTGEPFEFRGQTVRILPRPAQRPRPAILMGGASPASARRAARIADGYAPLAPRLYEIYLEELRSLGKPEPGPGPQAVGASGYVFVSDDPERTWASIGPHALHDNNAYAAWIGARRGPFSVASDEQELRSRGIYRVVTPDECVELAAAEGGLTCKPLVGGLDPDVGWSSLQLLADKVVPRLRSSSS